VGAEFQDQYEKAKSQFDTWQKVGTNAVSLQFNVNENLPCVKSYYDPKTFTRLDNSSKSLKCPLCLSQSLIENKGKVCETCQLTTLDQDILGFKLTENYD
jgi:hypothetical protein